MVEAPDNVGYPLAQPALLSRRGPDRAPLRTRADPQVDLAEIWLRNPRYLNEVLVQAREQSFGLRNIRFATRAGVRVLLDQAAGIVIDLLVALSLIALLTAGVMLAASARAEVQRRIGAIGIRRAVGETRGQVVLALALEAAFVAAPAAALGMAAGTIAILGSTNRLLALLNEPAPGSALVLPLIAVWLARGRPADARDGVAGVHGRRRQRHLAAARGRTGRALSAPSAPPRRCDAPARIRGLGDARGAAGEAPGARGWSRAIAMLGRLERVRAAGDRARKRPGDARDRPLGARSQVRADRGRCRRRPPRRSGESRALPPSRRGMTSSAPTRSRSARPSTSSATAATTSALRRPR